MFFLWGLSFPCFGLELATTLYEQERWAESRRESQRFLLASPEHELAGLMFAVASLREGHEVEVARGMLMALAEKGEPEIRALAGYEVGRLFWREGNLVEAWRFHRIAFEQTMSPWLYLHSSCALDTLRRRDRSLGREDPFVLTQLETTRPLWTRSIRAASDPTRTSARSRGGAGRLAISFYRHQIRPAIGSRCVLHPSCSEYFVEASHDHGWLAIPMVADRLVREPEVAGRRERPVVVGDHILFADPVSDHDFWMRRGGSGDGR
ncbi:MAG TPA: membrane protein insertion efficiency factor YidD [Kiritimatiellia bacterium]|nr:membrane protein insertion efficiency factor YidD [Kiritimatiellia bacterium]